MDLRKSLSAYVPDCEQEARDQKTMLDFLREHPDALSRENPVAHFTVSAFTVDEKRIIYRKW